MKSILLTILLFLSFGILKGQSLQASAFGGFGMAYMNNKSYNSFLESYSKLLSPIDIKRQKSTLKFGYDFGLEFNFEMLNFRISRLKYSGLNQIFELKEGNRYFSYNYGSIKTVTSLKLGDSYSKTSKYFGIIIGMGNTAVESYFKYPNGTKSLASEKDLNGIFDQYTSEIGFEYKLLRPLSNKLSVYVSASLSYTLFLIEMEYHSYLRSISSNFPLEYLPVDYETYMQSGNAYDYEGEYVKPNALKLDLLFGIQYKINN